MSKTIKNTLILVAFLFVTGCASVPMASLEEDIAAKEFKAPSEGMAGIYIYRNSSIGQMLKKDLFIDEELIGTSINKVYFYAEVTPGSHTVSTESEFSNNSIEFTAEAGKHYFFRQYIKFGVFVGGAGIEQVSDDEGIKNIQKTSLAKKAPTTD